MVANYGDLCLSNHLGTYTVLGHKSLRKLVCMKPGSRQPTVRAGDPISKGSFVRYHNHMFNLH